MKKLSLKGKEARADLNSFILLAVGVVKINQ